MSGGERELREADAQARRDASVVFDRPVVIEAGAGTGKTTILVSRIIAWCLGPGWEKQLQTLREDQSSPEAVAGRVAEQVVAITFTDAAAAEMAQRVAEALAKIEEGKVPEGIDLGAELAPELRSERATALLGQAHRLRVSTIHAFCSWILTRFPVEAGVHPSFSVDADGLILESIVHQVVEDALRTDLSGGSADRWLTVAQQGITPEDVIRTLLLLFREGVAAEDLAADPASDSAVQGYQARLKQAFVDLDEVLDGALDEVKGSAKSVELAELVRGFAFGLGADGQDIDSHRRLRNLRQVCEAVLSQAGNKLDSWKQRTFGKKEVEALGDRTQQISLLAGRLKAVLDEMERVAPEELESMLELVRPLHAAVRQRMTCKGVLTFDDLLRLSHDLLAGSPSVLAELRRGISQLLVDEFQDTDRSQCEIVRLLSLAEIGAEDSRPGLFIVGDPKQSIYGWRSADLEAYMGFVRQVEQHDALVHTLSVNFRSVPAILDEVGRVVSEVMLAEEGLQPCFQSLLSCDKKAGTHGFRSGGRTDIEYWVAWTPAADGDGLNRSPYAKDACELEAGAIAGDIVELHHDHGVSWKDLAVLMRTTTNLPALLSAFRRMAVPFEVAKDREYYRQPEVIDAAALVRLLIDPGDQLALLTILRSDVVGVPDAALPHLWEKGLPSGLLDLDEPGSEALALVEQMVTEAAEDLGSDAPGLHRLPEWPTTLISALESYAMLRHSLDVDSAIEFVEKMRTLWLAEVTAAARYLGRHRVARLQLFYSDLERLLSSANGKLESVARLLRRAVAGTREIPQTVPSEGAEDAVQVMTVHGAKGLDFEQVYLYQMGSSTGHSRDDSQVLRAGEVVELRLFGSASVGLGQARDGVARREAAELVRLLYVAMTRAKRRLVMSADWSQKHKPGLLPRRMVELLAHRWEQSTVDNLHAGGQARGPRADLPDQHWVLPAYLEEPEPGDSTVGSGQPAVPSGDAHLQRLAAARDGARQRMERPFSAGVSALAHATFEAATDDAGLPSSVGETDRRVATLTGTEMHRLMERLDLGGDLDEQLGQAVRDLGRAESQLGYEMCEEVRHRLQKLVQVLLSGTCLRRLAAVGEAGVVARELPMVLPPLPDGGPVGCIVGFADLVYRDPEIGELVVADYKTDAVSDDERIAARTKIYEPQIRTYARGLAEAMNLDTTPRCELWFLNADRIVTV